VILDYDIANASLAEFCCQQRGHFLEFGRAALNRWDFDYSGEQIALGTPFLVGRLPIRCRQRQQSSS